MSQLEGVFWCGPGYSCTCDQPRGSFADPGSVLLHDWVLAGTCWPRMVSGGTTGLCFMGSSLPFMGISGCSHAEAGFQERERTLKCHLRSRLRIITSSLSPQPIGQSRSKGQHIIKWRYSRLQVLVGTVEWPHYRVLGAWLCLAAIHTEVKNRR